MPLGEFNFGFCFVWFVVKHTLYEEQIEFYQFYDKGRMVKNIVHNN
jgi:hypothetical protein